MVPNDGAITLCGSLRLWVSGAVLGASLGGDGRSHSPVFIPVFILSCPSSTLCGSLRLWGPGEITPFTKLVK